MDERIEIEDMGHYYKIWHPEFKILEKQDGELWNAYDNDEHSIAVDKARFEKGDYILSEVPVEIEEVVDEVEFENKEYYDDDDDGEEQVEENS